MEKLIRNRNARIAYYMFFLSMIFVKALGLSSNNKVFMIVFVSSLAFLAVKIFLTEYEPYELIMIISLVLLSLIGFLRAKEQTYFLLAIAIAGMKGINFRDLAKKTFWVHLVGSFMAVTGSMLGYFQDKVQLADPVTGRMFHSYGYTDFNVLFVNMFIIAALLIYNNYEKLGIREFVLTNILMYWTYYACHSRTGYLLFIGMWFLILLDKKVLKEEHKIKLYRLAFLIPIIIVILSFVMPQVYDTFSSTKIMYEINRMLTGRLFIMNYYIDLYPVTMFGSTYEFWLNNAGEILEIVDNMYVTIYLYSGIVMLILYLVAIIALMKRLYSNRFDIELILVSVLCVYAFMEEFPLNPTVNPFAVLLAWVIFNSNIVRGDSDEEGSDYNKYSISL